MIRFKPEGEYIVVERAVQSRGIVLPDKVEPVSDEVFKITSVGNDVKNLKKGDLVCMVGYIHRFSYKGEKVILAKGRDVVCTIKEEA